VPSRKMSDPCQQPLPEGASCFESRTSSHGPRLILSRIPSPPAPNGAAPDGADCRFPLRRRPANLGRGDARIDVADAVFEPSPTQLREECHGLLTEDHAL